jgi:hypothetical protein
MPDPVVPTPGQQEIPGQQGNATPVPAGVDWEARYRGASAVINTLTAEKSALQGQLVQMTSQFEQANAQLALKETEKSVAVGERDNQLKVIVEAKSTLEQELTRLRALEMKVKVANKLNNPGLLPILDTIPSVADEATLEALMKQLTDWGQDLVKQRENQLLAGTTPPASPMPIGDPLPQNSQGWQEYVNKAALGSPEREQRMNAWRDWGLASQKS